MGYFGKYSLIPGQEYLPGFSFYRNKRQEFVIELRLMYFWSKILTN